jgi:hypothetical protein
MTWREWLAARQLLAEEQVGQYLRQSRREEDHEFRKSAESLRRVR